MKADLPVSLILDLWSLGHSASDVAERVGCHRKQVSRIVAQARSIRDPRAVLHKEPGNNRLIGRAGRTGVTVKRKSTYKGVEVVSLITRRP
jgi:hypothetical protein